MPMPADAAHDAVLRARRSAPLDRRRGAARRCSLALPARHRARRAPPSGAPTARGHFWPGWVWLALGVLLGLHLHACARCSARPRWPRPAATGCTRGLGRSSSASAWSSWALSRRRLLLADLARRWCSARLLRAARAARYASGCRRAAREQELVARVDELTRTRRGALDVQAAELRRIERDLHDGAQARLVALSIHLGRAEEQLADRPETAALVRRAREEATAAIAELRDLARGIAPPILADRGLAAASRRSAGARRRPSRSTRRSTERPPPVVETAAYFVVRRGADQRRQARAAARRRACVLRRDGRRLLVEVADDGPGGADPRGGGLTGLRHRVEALDGTLRSSSPPGGRHDRASGAAVRVVIAEDHALLREGIVALLREAASTSSARPRTAPGLLRLVAEHEPDLAIVDVRLPPTFTRRGPARRARGARRAARARAADPLPVRRAGLHRRAAGRRRGRRRLPAQGAGRRRPRRSSTPRSASPRAAPRSTARSSPSSCATARRGAGDDALAELTPRERETLALMAEGRTQRGHRPRAGGHARRRREARVEHLRQARLPATDDDHRRVLAVLAYLRAGG